MSHHYNSPTLYIEIIWSSVTLHISIESKASDKNSQGKAALPLWLHDKRRGNGQPLEDCYPQWLSGHVWLELSRQVLSAQRGECGWLWVCKVTWVSNVNSDESLRAKAEINIFRKLLNNKNACLWKFIFVTIYFVDYFSYP